MSDQKQAQGGVDGTGQEGPEGGRTSEGRDPILWSSDARGQLVFLDPAWSAYTGVPDKRGLGRGWLASVHREDQERVEQAFIRAHQADPEALRLEFRLRRQDGSYGRVSSASVPRRDRRGRFMGHVGAVTDLSERRHMELALQRLRECARLSGTAFHSALVRTLAETLGVRYVLLCTIPGSKPNWARTIASWIDGAPGEVLEYDLTGTPCQNVVTSGTCFHPSRVVQRFPDDPLLEQMGVDSYLGTPLRASDGSTLGLLAVLHHGPIDESLQPQVILELFAGRAAAEIERDRAEEALRARESHLRAVIETTPECVKVVAADGTLLEMNPAGLEMIDARSPEEAIGRNVYDLMVPEDRGSFIHLNQRVCSGERASLEFEIIGLRGTRRRMETHAVPLPAPDGGYHQLALTRDVTGRREAEAALRRSESQFRQLADTLPQIVWTARPDGFLDYYNERWYEYTGFPRDRFGDESWLPVIHPDDADRTQERWLASVRSGDPYEIEYRFRDRRTGGYRWFLGRAYPIRDETGAISRWFGTCTDIDDTKRAGETLRRQNERLRLLNETAAHLLTTDEPEDMVRGLFSRLREPLGVDLYLNFIFHEEEQILLLHSHEGVPEAYADRMARLPLGGSLCGKVAQTQQPLVILHVQDNKDPQLETMRALGLQAYACNPLMAGHRLLGTLAVGSCTRASFEPDELEFLNTLCHYVAAAYERTRLIKELRDADRRKDEFLATLAHELRNPLAPIRNSLDILRLGEGRTDVQSVHDVMERQVDHMVRLVDDLLEVSRITRGKIELRKQPVAVAAVVRSAIETSRPLIDAAGHTLSVHMPPASLMLEGDAVRLAQVVSNLLNNAAKYTEEGGHIEVGVRQEGEQVAISVRDNGLGIPPEMLPRVFEMFAQVDRTLKRSQGGLGIGLTLARSIVGLHGGRIEARSDGPGRGSEFVVRLPLTRAFTSAPLPEAAKHGARHPRRVLVVDDNRDAAQSLGLLLRLMGHEVRTAHSGSEALHAASRYRPEVVLLDIGLPEMDGYEVAQGLRQDPALQPLRIIAMTGYGQEQDRRRSRDAGFDEHLVKPASPDVLRTLLESAPAPRAALS